ncbi:hypothetical protein FHS18_005999 [Paenibacillus phyllosphaerae]|uniref:Paeninodin family lasso peptide n=1 Tax=Paenibacillus phyllosphaerae TaxID=274593 RepID=A0A7W5B3T1_9BACL|nr:paeninodin family lasso peptide [Paenibacillus phyllosphaerae]MBB3113884.1 hypothetical protein [Paenibacillus phyllosphaerae]
MSNMEDKQIEGRIGKKAWTAPKLEVLNVKETEHGSGGGGFWEFVLSGDCWTRSYVEQGLTVS